MFDTKIRSFSKTVTWRITATLTTIVLVQIFTGDFRIAMSIGSIEVILKMLIYYFHERIWGIIKWGIAEN